MAGLSHAAQAVLDAAYALPLKNGQPSIAAALRAAVEQVKHSLRASTPSTDWGYGWKEGVSNVAKGLDSIANELENQ